MATVKHKIHSETKIATNDTIYDKRLAQNYIVLLKDTCMDTSFQKITHEITKSHYAVLLKAVHRSKHDIFCLVYSKDPFVFLSIRFFVFGSTKIIFKCLVTFLKMLWKKYFSLFSYLSRTYLIKINKNFKLKKKTVIRDQWRRPGTLVECSGRMTDSGRWGVFVWLINFG